MNAQQRTDAMRRCHHVNPTNGETCNAPPMTGEHFCFSHNPRMAAEREEAQRAGGRNRRQPQALRNEAPAPLVPPNLPYVKLETRAHIQLVYEVTMNYVLQGQMDLRVANTVGYLAMGALATLDSQARADRQAAQDAAKAAEKPQKAAEAAAHKTEDKVQKVAEREPEQAGKTAQKQAEKVAEKTSERAPERTPERTEDKTENRAQRIEEAPSTVPSVYGFLGRDPYGRKRRIIYATPPPDPSLPPQPPGRR